jgi:hypothetical protein
MKQKLNSLQELGNVSNAKQEDVYISKMYKWRSVISRKNKKWFDSNNNYNPLSGVMPQSTYGGLKTRNSRGGVDGL